MKFQAFHVNPGEKLKKKDVNNDLSNFMSVFPNIHDLNKKFGSKVNPKQKFVSGVKNWPHPSLA